MVSATYSVIDEARRLEHAFARAIEGVFEHSSQPDYDFYSVDRSEGVEFKGALSGLRDLHAAVLKLALLLSERGALERATLVARVGRLSAARIRAEWGRTQAALRPDVARRLALVAIASDGLVLDPDDDEVRWLAARAQDVFSARGAGAPRALPAEMRWTSKSFDVWAVLFDAWLRAEAPLAIQDIAARSGASHPTVAAALERLVARGELLRTSDRRAGLIALPRRSLNEIMAIADSHRGTVRLADATGQRPDLDALLRRIQSKAPPDTAIGGVVAARHYDPRFDLHGTPRIDVTTHERDDLAWLRRVDPALRPVPVSQSSPVLVVHRTRRGDPSFETDARSGLTLASPAETVLDLYDLRLTDQADQLVRAIRKGRAQHG